MRVPCAATHLTADDTMMSGGYFFSRVLFHPGVWNDAWSCVQFRCPSRSSSRDFEGRGLWHRSTRLKMGTPEHSSLLAKSNKRRRTLSLYCAICRRGYLAAQFKDQIRRMGTMGGRHARHSHSYFGRRASYQGPWPISRQTPRWHGPQLYLRDLEPKLSENA